MLVIPTLQGISSLGVETLDCCRVLMLQIRNRLLLPVPRVAKRLMDLAISLLVGIVALPFISLIAILIKLESQGPVFYRHLRIGKGGTYFRVWKFRSMIVDPEGATLRNYLTTHPEEACEWNHNHKLKSDPRITRVGLFLRKTSLDELPQLWNVIAGEMSLVGPRPIVDDEVPKYGDRFTLYKQVIPGITGLWQVSGRSNITYGERVELDTYYVRNWSPWLDLYLLAKTAEAVVKRQGAY